MAKVKNNFFIVLKKFVLYEFQKERVKNNTGMELKPIPYLRYWYTYPTKIDQPMPEGA